MLKCSENTFTKIYFGYGKYMCACCKGELKTLFCKSISCVLPTCSVRYQESADAHFCKHKHLYIKKCNVNRVIKMYVKPIT